MSAPNAPKTRAEAWEAMRWVERDNYRVEVDIAPRASSWRHLSAEEQREACERAVKQIQRHIDDVYQAYVIFDTRVLCPFCKRWAWEPEPGCCDKAIEWWDNFPDGGEA